MIIGEWALAGVDDNDGGKLAAVADSLVAMFREIGVRDHFFWSFGGRGAKYMGCWLFEVCARKVWEAVGEEGLLETMVEKGVGGKNGANISRTAGEGMVVTKKDVFRLLWRRGPRWVEEEHRNVEDE